MFWFGFSIGGCFGGGKLVVMFTSGRVGERSNCGVGGAGDAMSSIARSTRWQDILGFGEAKVRKGCCFRVGALCLIPQSGLFLT